MSNPVKTILWFEDHHEIISITKEEWEDRFEVAISISNSLSVVEKMEPLPKEIAVKDVINIVHYENTEDGFLYLLHNRVDLVISHMLVPLPNGKLEREGILLLEAVKSIFPSLPFILYTALSGLDKIFKDAIPDFYMVKSVCMNPFHSAVKKVLSLTERFSEYYALRAYAKMINTLDVSILEPLLAEDFHYASQSVFHEIESKQEYMEYIVTKLQAIKQSDTPLWAEMATLEQKFPGGPCVVVAQGEKENLIATVLANVENGQIKKIVMCFVPDPYSAKRSGDYPV